MNVRQRWKLRCSSDFVSFDHDSCACSYWQRRKITIFLEVVAGVWHCIPVEVWDVMIVLLNGNNMYLDVW